MSLNTYRAKRDFSRTPEPDADAVETGAPQPRFVVQKHDATRLHYDLRLEIDSVLKSWAVPKGPSLDPDVRRLAIRVEDHPLEYGDFEGVIPEDEYGGGTVLLWDSGTWEPQRDPAAAFRDGKLQFRLCGEKLHGGWTLVRMEPDGEDDRERWLFMKSRDEEARSRAATDVLEEKPGSVVSGRDLAEIAADRDSVWTERDDDVPQRYGTASAGSDELVSVQPDAVDPSEIEGVRQASPPSRVEPQLAKRVDQAPTGDGWLHEMKLDGYRILCHVERDGVRFLTRTGNDWTQRFEALESAAAALPLRDAIIDGEIVVVESSGLTNFQALQNAIGKKDGRRLTLYAFDLLHLDGYDTTGAPLEARKSLLEALLRTAESCDDRIRYSDHLVGNGREFYEQACARGLEGIISKRRDRAYRPGRGRDWLKTKCTQRQDFVIAGYTDPSGSRIGFGALLLGVHDPNGRLIYAGRVGTGFTEQSLQELSARLDESQRDGTPFSDSRPAPDGRDIHWVDPELVAEVEFTEWTGDGVLRHPSFKGLREDLPPERVTRERTRPSASPSPPPRRDSRGNAVARIAGVKLTNPDRVLYPGQGLTKRDLAEYYESIAERMLPHVGGRPLTLVRCPKGRAEECFFQKHVNEAVPDEVCRVEIEEKKDTRTYLYIDSLPGLIALVQMGVLELHTRGARTDRIEHPNRLTFDLDPDPELAWARVVEGAHLLRHRLAALGLASFVKTTGGKGLHVVSPLAGDAGWHQVKAFSKAVAKEMAREAPDRFTANMSKAKRTGKIFIDYLRNGRGATAICAYSTRARPGAPVSVPISWQELESLESDAYTVDNLSTRLANQQEEPWAEYFDLRQSITSEMKNEVGAGAT